MRIPAVLSVALLVVSSAATLPAQSRDRDRDRDDRDYTSSIDTTVALARGAVVDLSLVSGDIIVTAWSRQEARVKATSERGVIDFDAGPSRLSLDVRSQRGHMGDTRYEVTVPVGTRVLARSVSGDQSIRGVRGPVEARSVSGELVIDEVGALEFESVSGDVRILHVAGDVAGQSVSGELEVEDVAGDARVGSTSGDIRLRDVRAKVVRAESVSGEIEFSGSVDPAGRYDFTSHSGDVTLGLPGDVRAQLGLETFSGDIESDFPLTTRPAGDDDRGRRRQRRLDATIGGGGARITVSTFSGTINLERGAPRAKE